MFNEHQNILNLPQRKTEILRLAYEGHPFNNLPRVEPISRVGANWTRYQTLALVEMKSLYANAELSCNLACANVC